MIDALLRHNRTLVKDKGYEKYIAGKYPNKKIAVVSCTDARLTESLPSASRLKTGDQKLSKTRNDRKNKNKCNSAKEH